MPPAARKGDMHTCPKVDPPPHVGGPILPACEPTVLIGNKPAGRITDKAKCNGPTDTIVQGSTTVIIGNKKAARVGDKTAHGGKIVKGEDTVIIGGAGSAVPVAAKQAKPTVKKKATAPADAGTSPGHSNTGGPTRRKTNQGPNGKNPGKEGAGKKDGGKEGGGEEDPNEKKREAAKEKADSDKAKRDAIRDGTADTIRDHQAEKAAEKAKDLGKERVDLVKKQNAQIDNYRKLEDMANRAKAAKNDTLAKNLEGPMEATKQKVNDLGKEIQSIDKQQSDLIQANNRLRLDPEGKRFAFEKPPGFAENFKANAATSAKSGGAMGALFGGWDQATEMAAAKLYGGVDPTAARLSGAALKTGTGAVNGALSGVTGTAAAAATGGNPIVGFAAGASSGYMLDRGTDKYILEPAAKKYGLQYETSQSAYDAAAQKKALAAYPPAQLQGIRNKLNARGLGYLLNN